MLVHSERPASPVFVFPAEPFVLIHVGLLVWALLLPLLRPVPVQQQREMVVLRGFRPSVKPLVHSVCCVPQTAAFVTRICLSVRCLPVPFLHPHTCYNRPFQGGGGGLVPGGSRRGSGVGKALIQSPRDARPDPGTDVLPVGFSKRQAAGGLRGGGVVFDGVVVQRAVHLGRRG